MKVAHFVFDEDLSALLLRHRGQRVLAYPFTGPQSVKHLVESLGIPHTEVGSILANGAPVPQDYQVQDGDELAVTQSGPSSYSEVEPRFILDGHLGRLASRLRMLGVDCVYRNEAADDDLASTSVSENRILVTRDRRLLMRKRITFGYLIRSLHTHEQLAEVVGKFGLRRWIRPFQRCIRCNTFLQPVAKAEILDRLKPLTRLYYNDFRICPACGQIYWKGSHFDRMLQMIDALG